MAFSNKIYKIKSLNNERQEKKTVVSSLNLELQIKIVMKFILNIVSTAFAFMVSEFQYQDISLLPSSKRRTNNKIRN